MPQPLERLKLSNVPLSIVREELEKMTEKYFEPKENGKNRRRTKSP